MRKLFVAVAKVFGILQVYCGLAYVTSIIPIILTVTRTTSNSAVAVTATSFSGESLPATLIGLLATLVLTLGVAWLLLFRTTWLADKLKIPEERESAGLAKDTILLTGVMLIGLYVAVKAAPALVSACLQPAYYGGWFFSSVLSPVLKLALGLLLAIRPRLVLSLLAKGEKTHGKRIVIGSLVILALLLVVGRGIARHPWFNRLPEYEDLSSRTLPGNTVIIPLRTNTPPDSQWYALSGLPQHPSTNGPPDFRNAPIADVIDFLKKETERTEPGGQMTQSPHWSDKVNQITLGMTRSEAEALLPTNAVAPFSGHGYSSGGRSRECYEFSDGWTVKITYSVPEKTKDGVRGWFYDKDPGETVVEGPILEKAGDNIQVTGEQ